MDRHDAYRAFVAASAAPPDDESYLFDTPRCRFVPEPSDELVAPPGARVVRRAAGIFVELPGGGALQIHDVDFEKLRAVLASLPCRYSRLVIELGAQTATFIEQAFSRVLFAPKAVAELELAVPAVEVVRFPGSPYEIVRSYWRNAAAVRRRIEDHGVPETTTALRELLLELHALMLLGEGGVEQRSSFYLPASRLGRKRPEPGRFYEVASGIERRGAEAILTSGARVSVPLLGGARYWELLAESVSDPGALGEREVTIDGVRLGQVLRARSEEEAQARPWFVPPRPLKPAHFEGLLEALRAARDAEERRDLPAALGALGAFHYRFVRAHPLPSANQSLSMSFVNSALQRLLGVGVPHLLLDQLALRFELPAYQELFMRAARAWSAPWPSASERARHLQRMTKMLNDLVSSIGSAASLIEARALLPSMSYAAELALLVNSDRDAAARG
jgi:hypothetical protein